MSERQGGKCRGKCTRYLQSHYVKGFYEESSKNVLHSKETLIKRTGFGPKQAKFRFDRQSC